MFTASIAEILHAKDAANFAALVAQLIGMGLLNPRSAAGDFWFGPVDDTVPECEQTEHVA